MPQPTPEDVTQFLAAMGEGDREAAEKLFPLVYAELHAIADRAMRGQPVGHTLQPTALVNEAYLRLVDQKDANWQNRAHYLAVAARAMRSILVDHARRKHAEKRGGGRGREPLFEDALPAFRIDDELVAIDEALTDFAATYPDRARVVELRFFGGLSVEETAQVLGISTATIKRDWRMAKAWLRRAMTGSEDR